MWPSDQVGRETGYVEFYGVNVFGFCLTCSGVSSGCCGRECTGQRYRDTREGGCPGPPRLPSGSRTLGRGACPNAGFQRSHFSVLRIDSESRPTKGQQGALQSFLSVHSPQIWFCFGQGLRCCSLKTLFSIPFTAAARCPFFYTIYILCNVNVNRRKRKETFSDGYHVLLILKGEPEGSQAEADRGVSHAQSLSGVITQRDKWLCPGESTIEAP